MSAILAGLRHPVIAAPMAGGPSTPELAAAVSGAGGLGFLGAGYLTAARLADDIAAVRASTDRPFGVNVFAPVPADVDAAAVDRYAARLRAEADRLGVRLGEPTGGDDGYAGKLELLRRDPVPVVSFTFGLPAAEVVGALRARGTEVWLTISHPAEAPVAAELGADALVVQGVEAGGHRGGSNDADGYALLPLLRLVASRVPTALVAAGGIADGAGIAAVLAAGATAAALGTAFLCCPEAGTAPVHRQALRGDADTRLTRAFTGRRARGLVNEFLLRHDAAAPRAYPHVNQLTQPLRAAARRAGDASMVNLWAGQAYPLVQGVPAADLVARLAAGARESAVRLVRRLDPDATGPRSTGGTTEPPRPSGPAV